MNKKYLIAICKKTGKQFKDYKNLSGALTTHIKFLYPDVKHPSTFLKRQFKKTNNIFWHEQFFNIIEKQEIIITKKCKFCDWQTKDIENKSGQYTLHLQKKHNINIKEYLKKFPSESFLFKTFVKKDKEKKEMLSNKKKFIVCKICNKKLKSLTNTHLKTHNITLEQYKKKFPNADYHSKFFVKKVTQNLKNATKKIKKTFSSKSEISIKNFLLSVDIEHEKNSRKFLNGVEIDIINHSNKIGIEFNGNLYHSENYGGKNRIFHLNKTKLMNKKGYSLIHIFEDEWELKQNIVKEKLLYIFNKTNNKQKIYARNCTIKKIHPSIKNTFLNKYHIQGEDRATVSLGAYYNENLVAVITFDNNRQMSKKGDSSTYELKRFCIDSDFLITGIAGKLLSHFIKNYNPKKIISFADRRWTLSATENLYTKLGFKLTKTLPPDYTYYNSKINRFKRFHKFSFGKSSLKNKFPEIYNDNKTEWEMMQELGYDRIWDCGKFKYELNI